MNLLFCINPKFRDLLLQCLRSIAKNGGEAVSGSELEV